MIDNKDDISKAAELLRSGELVVIPTETVYGLAANAFNEDAVAKIYALKQRPKTNPLILHIAGIKELTNYVEEIPDAAVKLMNHFWPGPLTVLLPKKKNVPDYITAGSERVAVRVPNNAKTLALLGQIDFPLVAPSANPFTYISPTKPEHLRICYGSKTPYILEDGECEVGIESTIIGFEGKDLIVYRLGSITVETLEKICGKRVQVSNQKSTGEMTPGMHHKHYSPKTRVRLTTLENFPKEPDSKTAFITFSKKVDAPVTFYLDNRHMHDVAQKLYAILYEVDALALDQIFIEELEETDLGRTLMDRLRRSSASK